MKIRILFVDDEPLALQGLQRMLRSVRNEWEMAFVESGPQALNMMSQNCFDMVVSDMLMPGMNGAQFLDEAKRKCPQTARFILSGHADRELILRSLNSVHQFLAKPCRPEVLKDALGRVSELFLALGNESIRRVISEMDHFPTIPSLHEELLARLQATEVSLEDVSAVMTQDMGMTSKLMQLANAGFWGSRKRISSVTEAVSCLGLDTIKDLVFTIRVFSPFEAKGDRFMAMLWRHSRETAHGARAIALAENAEQKVVEDAQVAGLLHDMGKFLLVSFFGRQYDDVRELAKVQKMELWAAERQAWRASHAEVGACLLGLWGLPSPIVEAVLMHHCPSQSAVREFSALTAVHVANALVQERNHERNGVPSLRVDLDYLDQLGMSGRLDCWREALRDPGLFPPEP